jgi:hypothetical protein
MKNYFLFIVSFLLITISASAQFTITGQLKDTINEPIAYATVMLLNPKDSTLTNFTATDSKGNFSFKNIKRTDYILKITHFNYMPQHFLVQSEDLKEVNLGIIAMKPIAHFLMEVVIKEARAPIFIKGDTVEYDATTFKVPPGSTVEDLLRKLPGIDVDAEGNISTMGKDVRTVYVDGKTFFGNDPKTVTQNLDAQAVSKVQVFTEKSEQEKLTGISDGSKEKVMNLELKEDYKKGYFGKASLGGGWAQDVEQPWRWLAKGSFNWFTDKQQLSFVGYGNNLNQSNLDWNEMQEFYGQNMQTGRDNGDFGFGSRGGRFYSFSTGYYSGGGGFSNNGGGGVNYNYYHKKIKFNAGYFYTVNQTWSDVFSNRQTFRQDESHYWIEDSTYNENLRQNHSFSTRFEYEIDSCNSFIARANIQYSPTNRNHIFTQHFQTSDFDNINSLSANNTFKNDNLNFDFLTIYNHKFKKKGRSFSASGYYNFKDGKNFEVIMNENEIYELFSGSTSDIIKFWVENNKTSEDHNVKSSLLYVEPLGKRFSLLGFYNFRNQLSLHGNNSKDIDPDSQTNDVDSLWLNYRNNTLYNRVGSSVNYGHNGINFSLGAAFQSLILNETCETKPQLIERLNPKPYNSFIPYFMANLDLPKNVYLRASYSRDVSEPSISYLLPMPNLTNSMYIILGNKDLEPERSHDIETSINYWNRTSMSGINFSTSMNFYESQIVYNQKIVHEEQGIVTVSKPDNVKGGNRFSSNIWSNFPIVKTYLTCNVSVRGSISNSPVFINDSINNTNSKSYGANLWFNLTIGQKLTFNPGCNVSQTFTTYSMHDDRNQSYINYGANLSVKWQFFIKTYLEANYRFTNYTNKKLEFNQNIHNLNVSIRQVIGKKNQWELRLAALDILNQTKFITQSAAITYVEYRTAPTLARYFLLTASYNIKGFDNKNTGTRTIMMY